MSDETLHHVFEFLLRKANLLDTNLKVLWHAGEPLTAGLEFYKRAFAIQKQILGNNINIQNSFQTNGTLLNDEWCELIKEHQIAVGVSLDGPKAINDANRVDRNEKGTFDRIVQGIRTLQAHEIPFGVISVLSEHSLDQPERLWNLYRELGLTKLSFLIEEIQGVHLTRILKRNDLIERIERFFSAILAYKERDGVECRIRELDAVFEKIRHWPIQIREIEQFPVGILNVSWDGKISTLSPDLLGTPIEGHGRFVLGDLASSTAEDIVRPPIFQYVYGQILKGYKRCEGECNYFPVCGGGQPSIKLYENGHFDSTETPSCQMRIKAATNVVLAHLEARLGISPQPGLIISSRIEKIKEVAPASFWESTTASGLGVN